MKRGWRRAGAALAAGLFAAAVAQAGEVQKLADGVYVLIGKSGNVVIMPGRGGALLIDDQRESDVAETKAAVAEVAVMESADGGVKTVINTHWHLDHCGGNAAFAAEGAEIVAQANVRIRRSTEQYIAAYDKHIPPAPPEALPRTVFDEALDLSVGAETVELRHVARAHTDGDTLVHLKKADVIHMGDVFFNGLYPFIDRSSGGSIQGMIAGVDAALAMADDATKIVPAHGAIATKAELAAYRAMLVDVSGAVQRGIDAGKTLEQIRDSDPTSAYDSAMGGDADRFVTTIYQSLTES